MYLNRSGMVMYMAALLAPLIATPIAYVIELWLPRGNISLVYLTIVLVVAVRTSTRPALLCAIVSFFAYNFFFTEPRLTLRMAHREDILTVSFFLFMASVAGQLTARLREQIIALKARERINRVQFELSKRLAAAVDKKDVVTVICQALKDLVCERCFAVELEREQQPVFITPAEFLTGADLRAVRCAAKTYVPAGKFTTQQADAAYYCIPLNVARGKSMVIGITLRDEVTPLEEKITVAGLLIQQASSALERTRLVNDLQRERLEKDRELLRSALLSSVSHDLRTPLASMIGATTTLLDLDESLDNAQKHELLEANLEEARRLDRYIQNLLDMTRLGYGELKLDRDWIALEEILNVTLKRIKPLLRKQNVDTHLASDMPLLYVHAALIEQALFNVLENAVKYSPEASIIRIVAFIEEKNFIVDVIDQGPGIPEEERKKIFDMFHTVSRGDRHIAGTGLGLAISQATIGAHGGSMQVLDGSDGKGVTLRMILPVREQQPVSLEQDDTNTGH